MLHLSSGIWEIQSRHPTHHPVTACFFLSHKRYNHISCIGMNHKLKIDIETKIYLISCPRYDLPHSVDLKYIYIPSHYVVLSYKKDSWNLSGEKALFENMWSIYTEIQVKKQKHLFSLEIF